MVNSHSGAPTYLLGPRWQLPLTFACRAICRATKDRFRSDTILATLVSTRPSMSVETQCSYLTQANYYPTQPGPLTFPALQGQQVAFVVQRCDDHMDKVELALPDKRKVILAPACAEGPPCFTAVSGLSFGHLLLSSSLAKCNLLCMWAPTQICLQHTTCLAIHTHT